MHTPTSLISLASALRLNFDLRLAENLLNFFNSKYISPLFFYLLVLSDALHPLSQYTHLCVTLCVAQNACADVLYVT